MIKLGDLILPIATTGKEAIAQIDAISAYYDRKMQRFEEELEAEAKLKESDEKITTFALDDNNDIR